MHQDPPAHLPSNPFYATRQDRVALARERYFERGERPSGLVSEPVLQSWTRCLGASRRPDEKISFDPVSKIRTATLLTRNRALIEAAKDPIAELETVIAGSQARAMLTCSEGVVLIASRPTPGDGPLLLSAARVGVNIAEDAVGTGAPGVAVRTGEVCHVRGGEHFFRCLASLHCAAAPVRDASGRTVAMLDLSSEAGPFRFDAGAMAHMYATSIENRLLVGAARMHLLLRFQSSRSMFGTPLEGLAAVDGEGRVCWFNGVGAQLFDSPRRPAQAPEAEEVFGLGLKQLLALAHHGQARPQMLPTGLTLWVQAQLDEGPPLADQDLPSGSPAGPPPGMPAEAPSSLGEASRELIEQALARCQGNISRAARMLGVSRGLLYRRLREWGRL
ncbi:Acetoin catabolism regulatory protein [Delftia tsuruhatensis]|uniref:helix-turn-helix domain-containing protein n=1 Tax=Delftia tsuruhatensis TaxID=180282 RepID=UPI001E6F9BB2|nr:helix-turn-helix domain-containing protein [Delftia tsuruhatensis]CAB5723979.1 Acetoin catabolism regulatory protein [Delftia tsuruhatensis]CAC9685778.1 Acetoin catabolism regulatory protein [Delftia tsuruhatensis]